MRSVIFALLLLLSSTVALKAQNGHRNIMVTGFWNPTGQMIAHFSTDTLLNPDGWQGENWNGLGFNIHSFFPKPNVYTGVFEVDYQNVLDDLFRIADSLKPIAIVSFGAGTGPWEIESGARNLDDWYADYKSPFYPTPNPPDSTIGLNDVRSSTLPLYEIEFAVNDELPITAYVDESNDLGKFLCEYTCFLGNWYRDMHVEDSVDYCLKSGFIHVAGSVSAYWATKAANVTLRETAESLLDEFMHVYGNITFEDENQSPVGTTLAFEGDTNYYIEINNEDGRYTIVNIENGNYHLRVTQGENYVFDSIDVIVDSTKQINIHFDKWVGVDNKTKKNVSLAQNYPNPFKNKTTIGFFVEKSAVVKLSVFDLSGRVVAELANAAFESGYHSIDWKLQSNTTQLQPGLYIYQLESNGQRINKQCVYFK